MARLSQLLWLAEYLARPGQAGKCGWERDGVTHRPDGRISEKDSVRASCTPV